MHQTPDADRIPLVVIGRGRRYMGQVVKAVQKFKLEDLVHFMGDVPFNFFPAIYYQSAALIYPSYYEGFGLPVIEALAVGIPVITSRSSSMPEAGGDQAVYIDPDSTEQLLSAMQSVLSAGHGSDEDIARRKKHVEKFAPESTTSQLMAVYDQVLNSGG